MFCVKDTIVKFSQGYRDTGIQGYRDPGIQGYRDTGIQGSRDTGIKGYRDTGIQGYRDTGIQIHRRTTSAYISGNLDTQQLYFMMHANHLFIQLQDLDR